MNSTEIGRKAEKAAATYLEMRGYRIVESNWRRPRCEIDIIAEKDGTVYFVEVKYRRNDDQGGGLEAITTTKLKQMRLCRYLLASRDQMARPVTVGGHRDDRPGLYGAQLFGRYFLSQALTAVSLRWRQAIRLAISASAKTMSRLIATIDFLGPKNCLNFLSSSGRLKTLPG